MFMAEPPCPPELILRSAALRQGFSSNEVQVKRRRGEWVALRAGAYVAADVLKGMEPLSRHLALIAATMSRAPEDAALSHLSAACLWDIDLWEPNLRAVQLTRPGSGSGHRRRSLQTFRTALPPEDVVTLGGYRVTGAARTVVDLAKQSAVRGRRGCRRFGAAFGNHHGRCADRCRRSAGALPGDSCALAG